MTKNDKDLRLKNMVERYRDMRDSWPSMYNEAMDLYSDMAHGGQGYDGTTSIRESHYNGYSDEWFYKVLSSLGEFDRYASYRN